MLDFVPRDIVNGQSHSVANHFWATGNCSQESLSISHVISAAIWKAVLGPLPKIYAPRQTVLHDGLLIPRSLPGISTAGRCPGSRVNLQTIYLIQTGQVLFQGIGGIRPALNIGRYVTQNMIAGENYFFSRFIKANMTGRTPATGGRAPSRWPIGGTGR